MITVTIKKEMHDLNLLLVAFLLFVDSVWHYSFNVPSLSTYYTVIYFLCNNYNIIRVRVVPRRTVVGDIDRRFDNLSGSHHQIHANCISSVYGIYVSGQLSHDAIGCFKSNRSLSRVVICCED